MSRSAAATAARTPVIYENCLNALLKMRFGKGANAVKLSRRDAEKMARQMSKSFSHFFQDNVLSPDSELYDFQKKYDGFVAGLKKNGINLPPEKLARIAVLAPNLVSGDPATTIGHLFGARDTGGVKRPGLIEKIRKHGIDLSISDIESILMRAPQWAYLNSDSIIANLFGGADKNGIVQLGIFPALDQHFSAAAPRGHKAAAILTSKQKHAMLVRCPQIVYQRRVIHNLFGRQSADGTRRIRVGLYEQLARLGANLNAAASVKLLADFPQLGAQTPKASINHFLLKRHLKFISGVRHRAQEAVNGQELTNGTSFYLFGIAACEIIGDIRQPTGSVNITQDPAKDRILRGLSYQTRAKMDAALMQHLGIDAKTAARIKQAAANENSADKKYKLTKKQRGKLRQAFIKAEHEITAHSRARIQHTLKHGEDAVYGEDRPNAIEILFDKKLLRTARTQTGQGIAKKDIMDAREQLYYRMHVMLNMRHRQVLAAG